VQRREAYHTLPTSIVQESGGSIHSFPNTSSWRSAKVVKHRDNFIFILCYYLALCVCIDICPVVTRQQLGENFPEETNTHTTIEALSDSTSSMRPVSNQRKAGDEFFPELLVILRNILHSLDKPPRAHYFLVPDILI
jgi:hypothetical protein